jgi:hypothetical protein
MNRLMTVSGVLLVASSLVVAIGSFLLAEGKAAGRKSVKALYALAEKPIAGPDIGLLLGQESPLDKSIAEMKRHTEQARERARRLQGWQAATMLASGPSALLGIALIIAFVRRLRKRGKAKPPVTGWPLATRERYGMALAFVGLAATLLAVVGLVESQRAMHSLQQQVLAWDADDETSPLEQYMEGTKREPVRIRQSMSSPLEKQEARMKYMQGRMLEEMSRQTAALSLRGVGACLWGFGIALAVLFPQPGVSTRPEDGGSRTRRWTRTQ